MKEQQEENYLPGAVEDNGMSPELVQELLETSSHDRHLRFLAAWREWGERKHDQTSSGT